MQQMDFRLEDDFAMWDLLFEQSKDGIVILDQNGKVYKSNKKFAGMLGYAAEEIDQLYVWDWDCMYSKEQLQEMVRTAGPGGAMLETRYRRKDGTVIDVELNNSGTVYKGRNLMFCMCRDVTERNRMQNALRESEKKYRDLSIVDELTRLYSTRHFFRQLGMEIDRAARYGYPLALMFLDLDDFKKFNDTYGHVEGDKVLARLGQVIKSCLRRSDVAFRYGGEEFAVLMPMTTCDEGAIAAERIRTEFRNENFAPNGGMKVRMTVSIGVAEYTRQHDVRALLRQVDGLLRQAKREGKDRTCIMNASMGYTDRF